MTRILVYHWLGQRRWRTLDHEETAAALRRRAVVTEGFVTIEAILRVRLKV